ncbi:MAG: NAD(P)-dependent oxidoreductase [Granulosicoccus sp.]
MGRRILSEALSRKHHVVTGSDKPPRIRTRADAGVVSLNECDINEIVGLAENVDVIVCAVTPCNSGNVIKDAENFSRALIDISMRTNKRIVLAGCGSSELKPEGTYQPNKSSASMMPEATAMLNACAMLSSANIDFTVVAPGGAKSIGNRVSTFRIGAYTVMAGAESTEGMISLEDFAIAMLHEVEEPTQIQSAAII